MTALHPEDIRQNKKSQIAIFSDSSVMVCNSNTCSVAGIYDKANCYLGPCNPITRINSRRCRPTARLRYDDHWKEKVWPNWPEDYDFAFYNSANPALIYPDILTGDETVRLEGLGGENGERLIRLPIHALMLQRHYADRPATTTAMGLDTLFLDIADADPSRHRVSLTWRETFDHETVEALSFGLVPFQGGPDFAEFWQPIMEAKGEQTDLRQA